MKKSEFRYLIREEIKKALNEGEADKFKDADPSKVTAIQNQLDMEVTSRLSKIFSDFGALPNSKLRGASAADIGLAIGLIAHNIITKKQK